MTGQQRKGKQEINFWLENKESSLLMFYHLETFQNLRIVFSVK